MSDWIKMTPKEKHDAMMAGERIEYVGGGEAYLDWKEKVEGPFVYIRDGVISTFVNYWDEECLCRIKAKLETRYMSRDEVIGFIINTPGIVVRLKGALDWVIPPFFQFDNPSEEYEWTTCTLDGVYGEPHEFRKPV